MFDLSEILFVKIKINRIVVELIVINFKATSKP